MKNLVFGILALSVVSCSAVEQPPADDILKMVQKKLPSRPLKLTGKLEAKAKNGFKKTYPVVMKLDWHAVPATAFYQIDQETLTITWDGDQPSYAFSKSGNKPTSEIMGTGFTWVDLSFSVLWWPNSKLVGEDRKLNRDTYIVDVPVPDSENTMRLWIDQYMGMIMEVQTLDKKEKQLRRLKIKSLKKMDGMWVAKDLELTDKKTGRKTTLQISELEWTDPKPTAAAFDPAESINRLAIDLYQKTSGQSGNLFLSPYSISTALGMTYGGARGETAEQMNTTLHFGGQGVTHPSFSSLRKKLNGIRDKGQVQLSVANSLWPQVDYTFLTDYLGMTKEFYGTDIEPLDFKGDTEASRLRINNWIEAKTHDKIKDLLQEGTVTSLTRLVLANAIYFKGNWASQFKKDFTREAPFTLKPGKTVQVPMMNQTDDFKLAYTKEFQALELPYEGGDLSMIALLPNKPDGLPELEEALSPEMISGLEFNKQEVMVLLPKFKFDWKLELSQTLAEMGMPLAFSEHADFSGMDGSKNLSIGVVVHQAFIEVNEEGTEAAAATGVGIGVTSMPPMFEANRPFLFLIRENSTGTILFIGRVTDPR